MGTYDRRRRDWRRFNQNFTQTGLPDNPIAIDTDGHISVGIGGGMGIDVVNGDLTMKIGPGASVDLGGGSDSSFGSGFDSGCSSSDS